MTFSELYNLENWKINSITNKGTEFIGEENITYTGRAYGVYIAIDYLVELKFIFLSKKEMDIIRKDLKNKVINNNYLMISKKKLEEYGYIANTEKEYINFTSSLKKISVKKRKDVQGFYDITIELREREEL